MGASLRQSGRPRRRGSHARQPHPRRAGLHRPPRPRRAAAAQFPLARLGAARPRCGALTRTLESHTDPVNAVAFSPDGPRLASAGDDGTLVLADVHDAGQTTSLAIGEPIRSLAWGRCGLAVAGRGLILLTLAHADSP